MPAFAGRTPVQKYKRVAKPLMVALPMRMIDELGDGPALGSLSSFVFLDRTTAPALDSTALLRTAFLEVDVDTYRAVVGAPLVGPDEGVLQSFHRARRREDVVDAPPDVPLARAAPALCQNSALLK